MFERKRKLHFSWNESLFYTMPVMMSVHTEDKQVQGVWWCLKERESWCLVGITSIKSLFYTIPAMSVHTEEKEVQDVWCWLEERESSYLVEITINIESLFYTVQVMSGLIELESLLLKVYSIPYQWWVLILKIKKCKVYYAVWKKEKVYSHLVRMSILYRTSDECQHYRPYKWWVSILTPDKEEQGLFETKKVTIWLVSSLLKVYFLYIPYQWWDECPRRNARRMMLFERKIKFLKACI